MKQTTHVTGTPVPVSVKAGRFLSWHSVARVLNALPLGICECRTTQEAKMYIKVILLASSSILLAGLEKGGLL